jgi:hypothetical protein
MIDRLVTTAGPVERLFAVTRLDGRFDITHGGNKT